MSRGGLCQAAAAAPSTPPPGPYGRMACQPATAGGHSRFVDMIPQRSLLSVSGRRQRGYSRPEWKDYPETSWTDRQQVPSGNGRYHRLTLL